MYIIKPTLDPNIGLLPCKPKGSICSRHKLADTAFAFIEQNSDPENPG